MKTIEDYYFENKIGTEIDESLKDLWTKFWNWLTRKKTPKEYDPESDGYDENLKKKYIEKYNYKAIKLQQINSGDNLQEILNKYNSEDNEDKKNGGFDKIIDYLGSYKDKKEVTESNKWLAMIFKSEDLVEICGLINLTVKDDKDFPDNIVVNIVDFLSIYNSIINIGNLITMIENEYGTEELIIRSKAFAKLIENEGLEIEKIVDKKYCWRI